MAFVSAMIQYNSHIKLGRVQRKFFAMLEPKGADADTIFENAEASLMEILDGNAEEMHSRLPPYPSTVTVDSTFKITHRTRTSFNVELVVVL